MNLDPGDELSLLADTARKFAAGSLRPHLREAEASRAVEGPVRDAFDAIGLAGLELPEDAGGAGLGALARALVNEELAAADAGAALALDAFGPALSPVLECGGPEALAALGAALAPADARAALLDAADTPVAIRGDAVDASLAWVPAGRVDVVVVLAGDEVLLVRDAIETTSLHGSGLRAAGASALHLERAPIALRASRAGGGVRARARARLYAASLLLGVLRDACDFSRAYALEREAFGRPIAHHQALAFLITDMQMALDGARLLVHEAAWRVDAGLPCEAEAAAAFAQCIEAQRQIGPAGVQILGGHGFMADYPMEKAMRESRALGLWLGGFDRAVEDAGRVLCDAPDPFALELCQVGGDR
jgi:alkylation response protein AidB-like acyl-CoA dehydrogenase